MRWTETTLNPPPSGELRTAPADWDEAAGGPPGDQEHVELRDSTAGLVAEGCVVEVDRKHDVVYVNVYAGTVRAAS